MEIDLRKTSIIGLYIKSKKIETFRKKLISQNNILKPIHYNDQEQINLDNSIDKEIFDTFLKSNLKGYFLFSKICRYDFTYRPHEEYSTVFIDFYEKLTVDLALSIFSCGINEISFGFSCKPDEYRYRNKIYTQIGENMIEAWVGRDLKKYVPGIYWLSFISHDILGRHNIPESDFPAECANGSFSEKHLLIRMFDSPTQWDRFTDRLDKICLKTNGFFSIQNVHNAIKHTDNYIELTSELREWL